MSRRIYRWQFGCNCTCSRITSSRINDSYHNSIDNDRHVDPNYYHHEPPFRVSRLDVNLCGERNLSAGESKNLPVAIRMVLRPQPIYRILELTNSRINDSYHKSLLNDRHVDLTHAHHEPPVFLSEPAGCELMRGAYFYSR